MTPEAFLATYPQLLSKYGSQRKIAKALNIPRTTIQYWLDPRNLLMPKRSSVESYIASPNVVGPLGTSEPYNGEMFGITKRRRPLIGAPVTSVPRTTLVIGDSHFHPAITDQTSRVMMLAGMHAATIKPEHIVHIGDASDFASLCHHQRNDTWKAKTKPSIRQDLDCMRENWTALNRVLFDKGVIAKRHLCLGNHDGDWPARFEDNTPECIGLVTNEIKDIVVNSGWTMSEYGEMYWIGDVGYTHVPLNIMGKPVAGQTAENTVAMQSTRDKVYGHTHRHAVGRRVKFGDPTVTVVNCGSSMPERYVGDFAQLTQGAQLSYGVLEVVDFDGRIQSFRFVSMRELEHRYGSAVDHMLR